MGFPGGSYSKESAWNAGDQVQYLGQEDPLEKEWLPTPAIRPARMVINSCLENSWAEEPGRLQSMGSQRVGHE